MKNLIYPVEFISGMLMYEKEIKNSSSGQPEAAVLQGYVAIKKLFSDICDCLDFVNFSIIVSTAGSRIISIESCLSAEDINRFVNVLTNNKDEFFMKTIYSHRFHSERLCEDNADYFQLLVRKIDSLEISGIVSLGEIPCGISCSQVQKTISEIQGIMASLGVDRENIIDSTSEILLQQKKSRQTILLFEN